MFAKQLISITLVLLVIFQFVNASVFSQLQFIKINSPKNGATFEAGEKMTIKYTMQPLVYKSVSMGRATSLKINFHKRSGDKLQNQLSAVSNKCPVTAQQDKFVTHTTTWTVPKNLKPGSYAFAFKEQVRVRSGTLNVQEIIKFSVVEK
ncbi:hypothetical protein BJ944DRAFT_265193 [Cunninghamella echinulata]|nr:hypothetical protein BJ944DRAFT_265193 [Cunninghamella echinulata]